MRHRRRSRRLGCKTAHRKAMLRNMVTSLVEHGRIQTTVTRAKEVRILADRMITLGKNGTLHARRQALSVIRDKGVVARLFGELSPMFVDRNGGYTRIVRTGPRLGDGAMMCIIELVTESLPGPKARKRPASSRQPEGQKIIPEAQPEPMAKTKEETHEVKAPAGESSVPEAEAVEESVDADEVQEGGKPEASEEKLTESEDTPEGGEGSGK